MTVGDISRRRCKLVISLLVPALSCNQPLLLHLLCRLVTVSRQEQSMPGRRVSYPATCTAIVMQSVLLSMQVDGRVQAGQSRLSMPPNQHPALVLSCNQPFALCRLEKVSRQGQSRPGRPPMQHQALPHLSVRLQRMQRRVHRLLVPALQPTPLSRATRTQSKACFLSCGRRDWSGSGLSCCAPGCRVKEFQNHPAVHVSTSGTGLLLLRLDTVLA